MAVTKQKLDNKYTHKRLRQFRFGTIQWSSDRKLRNATPSRKQHRLGRLSVSRLSISYGPSTNGRLHPDPAFSQPSRFADLQQAGFADVINNPSFGTTNCWQSQPSIYAWQISTKLKAPITQVDHLMFSVIHSQRHMAITGDLEREDLIGPDFPPVNVLFNQPGPAKPPSSLTEVMARYAQVLSNRGFALIPEKLASFMCMYRFVQWQSKSSSLTSFRQTSPNWNS